MVCHARSARASARHRRQPFLSGAPPLPPLAVLNLDKPIEREAHDFLVRATSKRDQMWKLLDVRRQEDTLLCVVGWVYPDDGAKPFALAEVSLKEMAVFWRNYATAEAARTEMDRRSAEASKQNG